MHDIEPYFGWRELYIASDDYHSPFYKREYNEFMFENKIYNYRIHPQWDPIGSSTLYAKVLYVDYDEKFAMIEFIGEWNDCLYNDIMYARQNMIDKIAAKGIDKFIFFCDNVLNFHGSDDSYYEDLYAEISEYGGWIAMVNVLQHVEDEMIKTKLQYFVNFGEHLTDVNWRSKKPLLAYKEIEYLINSQVKRLSY